MPTSLSDLVLLRRAINEDWPVPAAVRQAVVDELAGALESTNDDARRIISIVRTIIAMDRANLRLDAEERRASERGKSRTVTNEGEPPHASAHQRDQSRAVEVDSLGGPRAWEESDCVSQSR